MTSLTRMICTLSLSLFISGCSFVNATGDALSLESVEPWQRDVLAQSDMQLDGDVIRTFSNEHIYFSKEASTGGRGVGGGGCGCN